MSITLKSAYLPCESTDGIRYLVETLWPEGVEAHQLEPYEWLHELAPSYYLKEMALWKRWGPAKFREEYKQEILKNGKLGLFERIVKEAAWHTVTLLHHSRKTGLQVRPLDTSAYYLKEFFDAELIARSLFFEIEASRADDMLLKGNQPVEQWTNEGGR